MNLPRSVREYCKGVLKEHKTTQKMYEELKEDIIHAKNRSISGMPVHYNNESMTESKAIQLINDRQLMFLEKRMVAVEETLKEIPPISLSILILLYLDNTHKVEGAMMKLNIGSKKTFYRYHDEGLRCLARRLMVY